MSDKKQKLLTVLSSKSRRSIMKSVGAGLIGASVSASASEPATAKPADDYDKRMEPGNRDTGRDIQITNDSSSSRKVTLRIHRFTESGDGHVVFERSYVVPKASDATNEFPNIIEDSSVPELGESGRFRAEVETDTGQLSQTDFMSPVGRIRKRGYITVRLTEAEVRVNKARA